jgi:hypothetical protein
MEADIKLVDLRKDTLGTVREAIKIASTIGATGFKFFVNKNFIKNGLIITKIVPVTGDEPPKTQDILNYAGLKNLKKTLEFAKKVLVEDGEVTVEEKFTPVIHAAQTLQEKVEDSLPEVAEEAEATLPEETPLAEESEVASLPADKSDEVEQPKEEVPLWDSKKRKSKKAYTSSSEESE